MSDLPKRIFFNSLSITDAKPRRNGAYQVYVRTEDSYCGDAEYKLVRVIPELPKVSDNEQLKDNG